MFLLASLASEFQQTDIVADWQGAQSGSRAKRSPAKKAPSPLGAEAVEVMDNVQDRLAQSSPRGLI